MQLTITTNAVNPSTLLLADGTSTNPFALVADALDWGNSQFTHTYSGPRGTQGSRPGNGIPENRTVTLPIRVYGIQSGSITAKDALAANLKTLNAIVDELRRFGGKLTWQSGGQSYRQNLEVLGTDGTQMNTWNNRAETRSIAAVNVQLVCAPFALGDPMDINDPTFATYATDYVIDGSGAFANLTNTGGKLKATANTNVEHRLIYSSRGYLLGDSEVTVKAMIGSTLASWKAGAILWRTSSTDYVIGYVDDNGTNSRLRIDQVTAGATTNRATVNLGTRLSTNATLYVRTRTEGTTVYAEHWSTAPTPNGTPTTTTSWTAGSAWAATTFTQGAVVTYNGCQYIAASATAATDVPSGSTSSTSKWLYLAGLTGLSFTPQSTTAEIDVFTVRPFTYTKQTLPKKLSLNGAIPGDAPALANIEATTAQDAAWVLFGWSSTSAATTLSSSPTPRAPFFVFNGTDDDSTARSGWTTTSVTSITNNSVWSSLTTYRARWILDSSLLPTDEYSDGDRALEIWALVLTDTSTKLVSPTLVTSLQSKDGYGPIRYTDEWGTAGRTIPVLNSTAVAAGYRWTRLGTIHMANSPAREMALTITGTAAATTSTTATWGIGKVLVLPVKQRAALPTAKSAIEFGVDNTFAKWSPAPTTTNYTITTAYSAGQIVVFGTSTSYSAGVTTYVSGSTYTAGSYVQQGGFLYSAAQAVPVSTPPSGAATSTAYWTYLSTLTASQGNTVYRAKNAITSTTQKGTLPANNPTDWEPFEMTRVVQSDLGTISWQPTVNTAALNDRSVGGALLELPPGATDIVTALAKVIPDDPAATIAMEDTLNPYVASIHVAVTPRFDQLRTVS